MIETFFVRGYEWISVFGSLFFLQSSSRKEGKEIAFVIYSACLLLFFVENFLFTLLWKGAERMYLRRRERGMRNLLKIDNTSWKFLVVYEYPEKEIFKVLNKSRVCAQEMWWNCSCMVQKIIWMGWKRGIISTLGGILFNLLGELNLFSDHYYQNEALFQPITSIGFWDRPLRGKFDRHITRQAQKEQQTYHIWYHFNAFPHHASVDFSFFIPFMHGPRIKAHQNPRAHFSPKLNLWKSMW